MIRIASLGALCLFAAPARALEYVSAVALGGGVVASSFRLPADSMLVFDSMEVGGSGDAVARAHLVTAPAHSGKVTLQRMGLWGWGGSTQFRICLGDGSESCFQPSVSLVLEEMGGSRYQNSCGLAYEDNSSVEGTWEFGSALDSLRRSMQGGEWRLYRYGEPFDTSLSMEAGWGISSLAESVRASPWNALDSLGFRAQWLRADFSWAGHEGVGDALRIGPAETWMGSDTGWVDSLRLDGQFQGTVMCKGDWTWRQGLLLKTLGGSYQVVQDTLLLDTLQGTSFSGGGRAVITTKHVKRARIALADLDTLLKLSSLGTGFRTSIRSWVRFSNGAAFLDAGNETGRLELVDARGQILSKVSGCGSLRLPLAGQGVRWVRWRRGVEQGVVPVVF